MSDPKPPRLFVAFDVPTPLLEEVHARTEELRSMLPGARWTPVANQHVTLRFLGATPGDAADLLRGLCADVAASHAPARLRLTTIGAFPKARRARVVWAGIADRSDLSGSLHAALESGARSLGFAPEERPYSPHLTLARLKTPAAVPEAAAGISFTDLPAFPLDELVVYRSHLSSRGAHYEVWDRFPLG